MLRLLALSTLTLGLLNGCAATSKLIGTPSAAVTSAAETPTADTPLQQVLADQPEILKEHNSMSVQQVFNRVEQPSLARITVIRTGLMDDSVEAIRTEYQFARQAQQWQLRDKKQSYKCLRGKNTRSFQSAVCS